MIWTGWAVRPFREAFDFDFHRRHAHVQHGGDQVRSPMNSTLLIAV
jgi:hypothetical protein